MTTKNETKAAVETKATEKAAPAFKFNVVKNVTLPLLKPNLDVPVYVKVLEPVFQGKKIDKGAQKDMEAAMLANVVNLETGENMQMIVPNVLDGIFAEEYKENAYVGKCFSITKHPKASGKRYHPFSVMEIEVE